MTSNKYQMPLWKQLTIKAQIWPPAKPLFQFSETLHAVLHARVG